MVPLRIAAGQQTLFTSAALVAACALAFTIVSFWWLHARQGRLNAWEPLTFSGAVTPSQSRLRFPVVVYNTGAKPIIVRDLRLSFLDEPMATMPLPWTSLRSHLRPEQDDGLKMPAVFAVSGRTALQLFIEFGTSKPRYLVPEARTYRVSIEVLLGHKTEWCPLVTFAWHAERLNHPTQYIAYRNSGESVESEGPDKAVASLDAVATMVVEEGGTPEGRTLKAP